MASERTNGHPERTNGHPERTNGHPVRANGPPEPTNGHRRSVPDDRPCWLEVDLDAVADNVRSIGSLVGPRAEVCAVVKADAYGLGLTEVGRAALDGGARRLAVARVEEGSRLRAAGLDVPILLIAGFAPGEADEIVQSGLTPTVVQLEDALALGRAAGRNGVVLPVHVKVDTGLTRYGAPPEDAHDLARFVGTLPSLRLEGLYTHFASADEPDPRFTREQLACLRQLGAALLADGIRPAVVHAANSAGALAEPAARLDLVRVGITLSGHYPSEHVPRAAHLRAAVSFRARVLRVHDVPRGTSIGYGRTFRAERPMRVALVPAGYADGVPRAHASGGWALVRGARVPLVGRVSMDQCMVDVSAVPGAARGDEVVLFGRGPGSEIGLDEYAGWSRTIGHEALCRIGVRVPRLYRRGGRSWWGTLRDGATSATAAAASL